jgi:hypothetical protein
LHRDSSLTIEDDTDMSSRWKTWSAFQAMSVERGGRRLAKAPRQIKPDKAQEPLERVQLNPNHHLTCVLNETPFLAITDLNSLDNGTITMSHITAPKPIQGTGHVPPRNELIKTYSIVRRIFL